MYEWPPFEITGWALDEVFPQSRSVGLIQGEARTSSALKVRRNATAIVSGIGENLDGAGYVRMLNRQWGGKPMLTRVECLSTLWWGGRLSNPDLVSNILNWTAGAVDMVWTAGAVDMIWGAGDYTLTGSPSTVSGWYCLAISGLPPSSIVARPSEKISVTDGSTIQEAYVLRTCRSNSSGVATIYTDKLSAFSINGIVSIGQAETIVFEAQSVPTSVQSADGTYAFQWQFREAFASEYAGGFSYVDPWGTS